MRTWLTILGLGVAALTALPASAMDVQAAGKPDGPWKNYPTRTVADLPPAIAGKLDTQLSTYGGLASRKSKATGFFHTEKVNGRWWLVDPEGCLYINKGLAGVGPDPGPEAMAALREKYGSETNWAAQTTAWLRENGFNGLGGWSDHEYMRGVAKPMVYTRLVNFMASYGRHRGGTYSQPGHTGYPEDCIFVFDPAFAQFCDDYARQLADTKDDPWLLGCFSDNEMPLHREALRGYLKLPAAEAGHQAALAWLQARKGPAATTNNITEQDEQDFLGVVVARYFEVVSHAIKKYDPNHLYLGSRFYGANLRFPEIFKACGPYVDVVSVNYYNAWTPSFERMDMWEHESGRPVLITEWYAKGVDSGMENKGGAGWLVKTQRDRGLFYENFTLALLESKVCVGWHWFKYMDNDPNDKKLDAANRASNKGAMNDRYVPYAPLVDAMKQVNVRAYTIVDFFDERGKVKSQTAAIK